MGTNPNVSVRKIENGYIVEWWAEDGGNKATYCSSLNAVGKALKALFDPS